MKKLEILKAYSKKSIRIKNFITGYLRIVWLRSFIGKKFYFNFNYYPKTLFINLTNTCNAKCKMCPYYSSGRINKNIERLSFIDVKNIVDQVSSFSPNICFVGGGEPLTHPEISDIVSYVHSKKMFVGLTTNGFLLKEHSRDLVQSGIDYVNVSLDGPSEIHDEIRGVKGGYKKAIEGICDVKKMSKKVIIQTMTALFDINYKFALQLFEELDSLPIDVKFGTLMMNFITKEQEKIHNDNFSDLFEAQAISYGDINNSTIDIKELRTILRQSSEKYNVLWRHEPKNEDAFREYFFNPEKPIYKEMMPCPWTYATINSNGDVGFKCMDVVKGKGLVAGNIKNTSFKDIWRGDKISKLRKVLLKHKGLPVCNRCCSHLNPLDGL